MKKEYVKPVMEGEAFVANEYVAACWTATCIQCGATEKAYDALYTKITQGSLAESNGVYVYTEPIDGKKVCSSSSNETTPPWATGWLIVVWWFLQTFFGASGETEVTEYHPVSVTSGWGETHPNASV